MYFTKRRGIDLSYGLVYTPSKYYLRHYAARHYQTANEIDGHSRYLKQSGERAWRYFEGMSIACFRYDWPACQSWKSMSFGLFQLVIHGGTVQKMRTSAVLPNDFTPMDRCFGKDLHDRPEERSQLQPAVISSIMYTGCSQSHIQALETQTERIIANFSRRTS